MTFMEILIDVVNSDMIYYFLLLASILMVVMGGMIIISIKTTGQIILIDQIFKKKQFHRKELNQKYIIQGVYTIIFGIGLFVILLVIPYNGVVLFPVLIGFAFADFIYDYIAIKSSTVQNKESIADED